MMSSKLQMGVLIAFLGTGALSAVAGYIQRGQQIATLESEVRALKDAHDIDKVQFRKMNKIAVDVCSIREKAAYDKARIDMLTRSGK